MRDAARPYPPVRRVTLPDAHDPTVRIVTRITAMWDIVHRIMLHISPRNPRTLRT